MKKLFDLTYLFLLYIPVAWSTLNVTLATRNDTRIVFAVDTSASLELKNSNFKIKQSITTWIKYLAPRDIYVGIIELKQGSDGVLLKIDEPTSVLRLARTLPDNAFGPPCLFCGLQEATKLLGQTTANDTVVVLMEELSVSSPHDTPQYAIEQIGPNFPIFTVGLTENAAERLELLAEETNGLTDYVREITVARLLQSFSIMTDKDYIIITTEECDTGDECNVSFYIDDKLSNDSVLLIFICPSTGVANVTNFEAGNNKLQWDNDVHCWVSKQSKPRIGTWQVKQNKSEAATSVIVILTQVSNYPQITCYVDHAKNTSATILISSTIYPKLTMEENLRIIATVDPGDNALRAVQLIPNNGVYASTLPATNKVGRHTLLCQAFVNNTVMLTTRSQSFQMTESPQNISETQQTISASNEDFTNTVDPIGNNSLGITTPFDSYNSTTAGDTTPDEAHEAQNETLFKNKKAITEDTNEQKVQIDGAQITIVIVGAIIIIEIIFIVYKCKAKQVEEGLEKSNLIPYSVSYKDDFELHLNSMQYKDNFEEI